MVRFCCTLCRAVLERFCLAVLTVRSGLILGENDRSSGHPTTHDVNVGLLPEGLVEQVARGAQKAAMQRSEYNAEAAKLQLQAIQLVSSFCYISF